MTRQSDAQNSMRAVSDGVEKTVEVRVCDNDALQQRMKKLHAEIALRKQAEKRRADELAQIELHDEDVQLLARECCWDVSLAEQRLREKKGDLMAVLRDVVGLPGARTKATGDKSTIGVRN